MLKDVNDPARSDEMYFEGISERPLTVGDYRTAIGGKSETYSLTVYVRKQRRFFTTAPPAPAEGSPPVRAAGLFSGRLVVQA